MQDFGSTDLQLVTETSKRNYKKKIYKDGKFTFKKSLIMPQEVNLLMLFLKENREHESTNTNECHTPELSENPNYKTQNHDLG